MAGAALALVVSLLPGPGWSQQREYNYQPPVETPKAQPSDSKQVLVISVPKQLHGCWAGDLKAQTERVGFHQHAKLCFTDRTWSFDISHPDVDLSALGMEMADSQQRRQMTGAGKNWVEWNTIWTYDLRKGLMQMDVTSENHWRCELTEDHQALWCQDSATNYVTDPQGHKIARQRQATVRMAREK